jgi:hypothetical protein
LYLQHNALLFIALSLGKMALSFHGLLLSQKGSPSLGSS